MSSTCMVGPRAEIYGLKLLCQDIEDILYKLDFDTAPARSFLHAGYGLFLPGDGAEQAKGGNDDLAHYFYLQTGLAF